MVYFMDMELTHLEMEINVRANSIRIFWMEKFKILLTFLYLL